MSSLLGVRMTLRVGEAEVPVVSPDADMIASLRSLGHEPSDYNLLHWPIGAAHWASGTLLIAGDDALELQSKIGNLVGTLTLESEAGVVEIKELRVLAPEPVLIFGRGAGGLPNLYTVGIRCLRWAVRSNIAGTNYNTDGGEESADLILPDLAEAAGLPLEIEDQDGGHVPYAVMSRGMTAAPWIDEVLAESGRVYVYDTEGNGRAERVDRRNVLAVLLPLNDWIVSGGIRYNSAPIPGHIRDVTLGLQWLAHEVPETVAVRFHFDDVTEEAVYNAMTAGLHLSDDDGDIPVAFGAQKILHDNWAGDGDTARAARREFLAEAYYRRFLAGGMKVRLFGWHSPPMGGSCQSVTWRLWNGEPYTDLVADYNADILGFGRTDLSVTVQGDRVYRPSGRLHANSAGLVSIGRVRVISASAGSPADFDTLVYSVELIDENISLPNLGADPASANFRVVPGLVRYGEGWRVRPAREGSVGIAMLFEFDDEPVLRRVVQLFDEVVAVAECP